MKTVVVRGAVLAAGVFLAISSIFGQVTDLVLTKSGDNVVLNWTTGTPSFRALRSTTVVFLSGNTTVAQGLASGPSADVGALQTPENYFYQVLGSGEASPGSPAAVSLLLPQSTAFSILGHSCGGIQEKAYVSGFAPTTGYPTGYVYIQTRCGGSGRGGGYHTTTYSAWVSVTWNFAGSVVSTATLATMPAVNPTFSATDVYGDQIYNLNNAAFLVVPAPAAPTLMNAVQSGDQFEVSWTPNGVNPVAIKSSTLTATPIGSTASIVTTTVSGSAADGLVGPLRSSTTYQITVVNTTIGGAGPASNPVSVTTVAASIPPSAPTGVTARWAAQGATTATLVATWQAAVPGNSPVDQYQIAIDGSDDGGTFTQTVSGTTLTTSFVVDWTPDWSVTVSAHNAAGWSPASASFMLGGL